MEELVKKLEQLKELIKAVKANVPQMPTIPAMPTIKPPGQPTMSPKATAAPKIGVGEGPNSKKDPKKVAQQIKDGSMSTKTQKIMIKADTGQWYLREDDPASV